MRERVKAALRSKWGRRAGHLYVLAVAGGVAYWSVDTTDLWYKAYGLLVVFWFGMAMHQRLALPAHEREVQWERDRGDRLAKRLADFALLADERISAVRAEYERKETR